MRVLLALLALAPAPALACAMMPREDRALAAALDEIDAAAATPKPAEVVAPAQAVKPEPARPAANAIPEVAAPPVVQPQS